MEVDVMIIGHFHYPIIEEFEVFLLSPCSAIVLDEPITGQDRGHQNKLLARMKMLNEAGKTIILVSHEMGVVAEYASRSIVMKARGYRWMPVPGRCFPGLIFLRRRQLSRICWPGRVMMCEGWGRYVPVLLTVGELERYVG